MFSLFAFKKSCCQVQMATFTSPWSSGMPAANSMHRWGVAFIWLWFSQTSSGQRERKVWDRGLEHLERSRATTKCKVRSEGKRLKWMEGERRIQKAPWKQQGGSQCPSFRCWWGLETGKNVVSKRDTKPSTGSNPGQLHPQPNLLCWQCRFQGLMS